MSGDSETSEEHAAKQRLARQAIEKVIGRQDLAGDEANYPGELFVDHLRRAKDAGLRITVHAGEAAGPESVWQALREMGTKRIGHGLRSTEDDPALLDYMVEHEIGIESNMTSNVQTSLVPEYAGHPLRVFLERGLLATIDSILEE